jgi:hypothetical protein
MGLIIGAMSRIRTFKRGGMIEVRLLAFNVFVWHFVFGGIPFVSDLRKSLLCWGQTPEERRLML